MSPRSGRVEEPAFLSLAMIFDGATSAQRRESRNQHFHHPLSSWAAYTTSNTNRMDSTSVNSNQINGYDAAGDMLNDGINQFLYDAEGRVCAVGVSLLDSTQYWGYVYNAEGQRVAKLSLSSFSCDLSSGSNYQVAEQYVIGQSGETLAMLDGTGKWQRTNVYGAGKQLATYDSVGLHFQITDPLGSRRVQTSSSGVAEYNCENLSFGDQQNCFSVPNAPSTAEDATPLHFTGKERDTESGNDYFGARYYASTMGRLMSPDWSAKVQPVPYAKLGVNISGTATFTNTRAYDNRMRSMFGGYNNSGGVAQYSYCMPESSNTNCSGTGGFAPNGNVAKVIDSAVGTWTYNYDTLNRLASGAVGSQYGCWTYDVFGNRQSEALSGTACNNNPPLSSWATYTTTKSNRMDTTSTNGSQSSWYDAAGNITFDGLNYYLYDGEGRVCAVKQVVNGTVIYQGQYIYDAAGNRVGRGTITTFSCNKSSNGFAVTAGYVVGLEWRADDGDQRLDGLDAHQSVRRRIAAGHVPRH